MLEAAADFAKSAREAREQHTRSDAGQVAFVFPLTTDIAKEFGIHDEEDWIDDCHAAGCEHAGQV